MTTPIWIQRLLAVAIIMAGITLILLSSTALYSAWSQMTPLGSMMIAGGCSLVLIGMSNMLAEQHPRTTSWLRIGAWIFAGIMIIMWFIMIYDWFGGPTNPPPIPPTVTSS